MVERLAGNAALLPPEVIAEIAERTDGVPLFVEEMTKAVLEAGTERGREIAASVPSTGLGVPATLQASLMARLDRLGGAAKGGCPDRRRDRPRILVRTGSGGLGAL
jgi:predicted ATPase